VTDALINTIGNIYTDPAQLEGLKEYLDENGSDLKLDAAKILINAICNVKVSSIKTTKLSEPLKSVVIDVQQKDSGAKAAVILAKNESTRGLVMSMIPEDTMINRYISPSLKPVISDVREDYKVEDRINYLDQFVNSHEPHSYQTWIMNAYPDK